MTDDVKRLKRDRFNVGLIFCALGLANLIAAFVMKQPLSVIPAVLFLGAGAVCIVLAWETV
jgi:hypothetical protein